MKANADEHPDLYWAIRGGGGNFGVVTSFKFRLHEVDTVIAGPTFWPVEQAAEVLSAYREFLPGAPRELYGFYALQTVPPADAVPERDPAAQGLRRDVVLSRRPRTRRRGRWPRCSTHCRSR